MLLFYNFVQVVFHEFVSVSKQYNLVLVYSKDYIVYFRFNLVNYWYILCP